MYIAILLAKALNNNGTLEDSNKVDLTHPALMRLAEPACKVQDIILGVGGLLAAIAEDELDAEAKQRHVKECIAQAERDHDAKIAQTRREHYEKIAEVRRLHNEEEAKLVAQIEELELRRLELLPSVYRETYSQDGWPSPAFLEGPWA